MALDPDTEAAIVGIGENEGANIMTAALLKQLEVKRIVCRVTSPLQKIVLGGYFAALQDWLVAPQRHGRTAITASTLGFTAGGKGAALAAVRRVLDDPTVVPVKASAPKTGGSHEGASA